MAEDDNNEKISGHLRYIRGYNAGLVGCKKVPGLDSTELIFDNIHHRVSTNAASLQRQPPSFKLLEKLAESPG